LSLSALLVIGAIGVGGCASGCATALPVTTLEDEPPRLLNAFFGLDDALPDGVFWLCPGGGGTDGMPVTFSRRLSGTVPPAAFAVVLRSGLKKTPLCATTAPANEASEHHTVLLVGDLGGVDDPPVGVEVVADLWADGVAGAVDNARGATVEVTPLLAGPTLVLAIAMAPNAIDSDCPPATTQLLMVTWSGGVVPDVDATQEMHRLAYTVTTDAGDVTPMALGDLDDRDNYVHLCLDTAATVQRVRAQAAVLVDPNNDENPETSVTVFTAR
jgi:hypothetical protein